MNWLDTHAIRVQEGFFSRMRIVFYSSLALFEKLDVLSLFLFCHLCECNDGV